MKKKKSKSVNALAEPKTRKELLRKEFLSYKSPTIPELRGSVKSRIDEIVKGEYPSHPVELANIYLNHREAFPLPLQVRIKEIEKFMEKGCEKLVSSGKIKPQTLETTIKPMMDYCLELYGKSYNEVLDGMRGRINSNSRLLNPPMKKLEKNYDKKTVDAIIKALVDFEPYLEPSDRLDLKKIKKNLDDMKKRLQNIIKAVGFLLEKACLTDDTERDALQRIKVNHEVLLKWHLTRKKTPLDPVREALLNRNADATILSGKGEGWTEEYRRQCVMGENVFTQPHGRPKEFFPKAMAIVIFRLLENKDKQIKWRYTLTADIINQCFKQCLKKELTPKDIDNVLHSS